MVGVVVDAVFVARQLPLPELWDSTRGAEKHGKHPGGLSLIAPHVTAGERSRLKNEAWERVVARGFEIERGLPGATDGCDQTDGSTSKRCKCVRLQPPAAPTRRRDPRVCCPVVVARQLRAPRPLQIGVHRRESCARRRQHELGAERPRNVGEHRDAMEAIREPAVPHVADHHS